MAWAEVKIKAGDVEVTGQSSTTASNPLFSIPAKSGIDEGGVFEADGKAYTAVKVVDFAQRGETLLVEAKESKNDKSNARRARDNSGGETVQDTPVD